MSLLKSLYGFLLFKGLSASFFAKLVGHYGICPGVTSLHPNLTAYPCLPASPNFPVSLPPGRPSCYQNFEHTVLSLQGVLTHPLH